MSAMSHTPAYTLRIWGALRKNALYKLTYTLLYFIRRRRLEGFASASLCLYARIATTSANGQSTLPSYLRRRRCFRRTTGCFVTLPTVLHHGIYLSSVAPWFDDNCRLVRRESRRLDWSAVVVDHVQLTTVDVGSTLTTALPAVSINERGVLD